MAELTGSRRTKALRKRLSTASAAARRPAVHAGAAAAFAASALAAWLAQQSGYPLTAAILFLLGVTIVGALEGVRGGIIGALAASIVYNFILVEPAFRFSLATLDDYVPLIAFNLAAAASGFIAGRLNDRARAAELATRRVEALLSLSHRLQAAVGLEDVAAGVATFADTQQFGVELYVLRRGLLETLQPQQRHADAARLLLETGGNVAIEANEGALLLSSTGQRAGVLFVERKDRVSALRHGDDLDALANLVSIAVERCLLLEQLAEAELIRKSEEFKTALLSSVSHDLRTPLAAISASASSLDRYGADLPDKAKADMLKMIREQCRRLDRYTTNLLNLGRLQAGLDSARFSECDAIEALASAISHAKELSDGREFVRAIEIPEAVVRADPVMLEQIFYNLLENSVRYSAPASPIHILAERADDRLVVRVKDEGEGIAIEDLERVFDRFYRASDKHSPQATGLGLAIAKGFTEAFGGRIRAERRDDAAGGTIITIEIPMASAGVRR